MKTTPIPAKQLPCCTPEPTPERCYAPAYMKDWLESIGIEWLGDRILSPGCSYEYAVLSGPCCRLYAGSDRPEPHSFERAWEPRQNGRGWAKPHLNYLSYLTGADTYTTVRWRVPGCDRKEVAL